MARRCIVILLLLCFPVLAGCMTSPPGEEAPPTSQPEQDDHPPGTPNPEHDAEVELWVNTMPGSTSNNLTAYIRVTNLTGEPTSDDVNPTNIHLQAGSEEWERAPTPGSANGTWYARDGPSWPAGTLVNVTLSVEVEQRYTRLFFFDEVEVKAAG